MAGPAAGPVMCVVLGAANAYLGLKAGADDRRDLSGGGHRHGRAARIQRHHPRGEHRANRRIDRRIRGGRRDFYDPRILSGEGLAAVRWARSLLEIHRADAGRRRCWASSSSP